MIKVNRVKNGTQERIHAGYTHVMKPNHEERMVMTPGIPPGFVSKDGLSQLVANDFRR